MIGSSPGEYERTSGGWALDYSRPLTSSILSSTEEKIQ
jgi:hypothetical protein